MIDILIVGAGPTGLCAAKTFLEHDPSADVVLLDAQPSPGGVWARERLYPSLRTNNLAGTLDFSDFAMGRQFGVAAGEHVSGESMHAYLRAYAERFDILRRVRFCTKALSARRRRQRAEDEDDEEEAWGMSSSPPSAAGWDVVTERTTADGGGGGRVERETLACRKLVVATGVLSTPHVPSLAGLAAFDGRVVHSAHLGGAADALVADPRVQTVAVLGGGKSAYDAVYLAASSGRKVEWIIRRSGRGPSWVFPPYTQLGPFRAWREKLVTRRFFACLSPWPWPDVGGAAASWLRRFLHDTPLGRAVRGLFWSTVRSDTIRDCAYRTHPSLRVLEPEQSPFWYGTSTGTMNYVQDFHAYIRDGTVTIRREDISHLSSHSIHLADGTVVNADALIMCTGFSAAPALAFEPPEEHSDLGIPTASLSRAQRDFWADLDGKADVIIAARFEHLRNGPGGAANGASKESRSTTSTTTTTSASTHLLGSAKATAASAEPDSLSLTPWRLYRGIAPPGPTTRGDRSLVFLGMFSNVANTIRLEVQCVWALAYLQGRLGARTSAATDEDTEDESDPVGADIAAGRVFEEAALLQRFARHRAPLGHGASYPDLTFDQLPYWDGLLRDLGLEPARKRSWLRELFEPYGHEDYRGLVQEWIAKNK